jgi:hypothetical protein
MVLDPPGGGGGVPPSNLDIGEAGGERNRQRWFRSATNSARRDVIGRYEDHLPSQWSVRYWYPVLAVVI